MHGKTFDLWVVRENMSFVDNDHYNKSMDGFDNNKRWVDTRRDTHK